MEDYIDAVGSELLKEHVRITLLTRCLPALWKKIGCNQEEKDSDEPLLSTFKEALGELFEAIRACHVMEEIRNLYPESLVSRMKWDQTLIDDQLVKVLSATIPCSVFPLMEKMMLDALENHQHSLDEEAREMEVDESSTSDEHLKSWRQFQIVVLCLQSKKLLQVFLAQPVASVLKRKVYEYVDKECGQVFDAPVLEETVVKVLSLMIEWLQLVFNNIGDEEISEWRLQILHHLYYAFGKIRIKELFNIIVEFPESLPALQDLKECLQHTNLRGFLKSSLKAAFERRLLHPGANTSDILTQYILSIRALHILDPSGVVLENVCDSVRSYLRTRDDTVFCIMASLTDDSSNELSEELARGQTLLLDLSEECDDENQDFDSWEPDPIDADPTKTSKSRQTSDIISILVNIYGSQEMFVGEYRNLLADRLLQTLNYDTSREIRNLELLKLRFGEASLHFCDVMLKDVADSRRINAHIHAQLNPQVSDHTDDMELNTFILSHVFWPSFKGENFKPPAEIQEVNIIRKLDSYSGCYQGLKGMRTLEWCHNLGLVELELELEGEVTSFNVTPPRAILIWYFQEKESRTVEELCTLTEGQPAAVRRHLLYWVSQGVLQEGPIDTYTITKNISDMTADKNEIDEDSDSTLKNSNNQDDSEEMLWSYISAMLTNLGSMPLERISTMLKMFMTQGKECSTTELKTFLDKKVKAQQLVYSGGEYQLS